MPFYLKKFFIQFLIQHDVIEERLCKFSSQEKEVAQGRHLEESPEECTESE